MSDEYSREETELAVYGYTKRYTKYWIPVDVIKSICKFWDATNYWLLKGAEFEKYIANKDSNMNSKEDALTDVQLVEDALSMAKFTLTMIADRKHVRWSLEWLNSSPDIQLILYLEIFCEQINYSVKNKFHLTHSTKCVSLVQKHVNFQNSFQKMNLSSLKHKEKQVTFGAFIQTLSKKITNKQGTISRFDNYHKRIVMKSQCEFKWHLKKESIHKRDAMDGKVYQSNSFDHGNWCLYFLPTHKCVALELLRHHGFISELHVSYVVSVYMSHGFKMEQGCVHIDCTSDVSDRVYRITHSKDIGYTNYKKGLEITVKMEIVKVFKCVDRNEKSIAHKRYWYVYGIQLPPEKVGARVKNTRTVRKYNSKRKDVTVINDNDGNDGVISDKKENGVINIKRRRRYRKKVKYYKK